MDNSHSLVSVIVPVYNREKLVTETVASILDQTYRDIEIILVNDGSTDRSLSVIKNLQQQHPNLIRVIDQENQGQTVARNQGIKAARGKYIAFLDSDDLWSPDKLKLQIPLFTEGVGLVYGGVELINENGETTGFDPCDRQIQGHIFPQLLVKNRMTGGSVVVLREALDSVGMFDPEFSAAENWDLWLRICKKYEARLVDTPIVKYRLHQNNMSKDMTLMQDAKRQIMEKHCDRHSPDKLVAQYSKLAEADLFYKLGVHYFSQEQFGKAIVSFLRVIKISPFYEDTPVRLVRSMMGRSVNRILRKFKKTQ
ncbi:glycosyltransferase family A protein [Marinobacter sp.]|uniref:glycosyltransferase family A protein n=1 Tax=Marinobacter sp. TaxID=50741 RepID=UPI001B632C9C|nr:glycosyltransferase family A protein [Marinobacter sp.]MBQ0831325.1 glycosyltransferase [Marinobacter sp.]